MYKKEKSQALIISLWILAILTILAISIGRQVSMALYLSKYQKNRLKAISLAKAGINRAIVELERDSTSNYDALNETWSTGKDLNDNNIFENIEIVKDSGEKFTVCITDEERKINLNNTNKQLLKQELIELFILKEFEADAQGLAETIIAWRDLTAETEPGREIFRNGPLGIPEELLPILEYYYQEIKKEGQYQEKAQETFSTIENYITVYGESGKVNINTVPIDIFTILANSVAKDRERNCVDAVINEVLRQREEQKYFKMLSDIIISDDLVIGTTSDIDFFNNDLKPDLIVTSNYFKIEATGRVSNITKNITAIYDRGTKKTVYWHEN